jgi:hypothetical protein
MKCTIRIPRAINSAERLHLDRGNRAAIASIALGTSFASRAIGIASHESDALVVD